jgi:hypothetical protein
MHGQPWDVKPGANMLHDGKVMLDILQKAASRMYDSMMAASTKFWAYLQIE